MDKLEFDFAEQRLLNNFQHDFPLTPRPYAELGKQLGISEDKVIKLLAELQAQGAISRVGPVFMPNRVGVSTLAAMAVPVQELEAVAAIINDYPEVNHNYEREHEFNLWFVLTAPEAQHLQQVIDSIEFETGYQVMNLPMLEDYFIDLGFTIQWT
jgi:DNA-binding Lrp family transcriptional regulator